MSRQVRWLGAIKESSERRRVYGYVTHALRCNVADSFDSKRAERGLPPMPIVDADSVPKSTGRCRSCGGGR